MSAVIRPTFYETQILAAADLEAQLQYARTALARHERHQHSFGILTGLELSKFSDEEIDIAPGMLIDSTGRQVVVAETVKRSAEVFMNFGVVSQSDLEDAWYPVFLAGIDIPQPPSPFRREQCNAQATSRIDELYEVSFGRPGSETAEIPVPTVDSPTSGAAGVKNWPVVVGFVQWNVKDRKFKEAQSAPDATHRPRYAGVYADSVVARGGSLSARTRVGIEAGKPAMLLEEDPWHFQIGKLKPNGSLEPLLTLDDGGNLEVSGKLKGTLAAGSVVAESGLVSDGVTIPLPAGVTQKMLDDGDAQTSVMLSPRIDQADAPDTTAVWAGFVLAAYVDELRQAHCRVRWYRLSSPTGTGSVVDRSTSFSYLITASVKQK